jgi:sugar/nucleoside kinase (ribokinase family)
LQTISSIGAGDTFNAGILYEISRLLLHFPVLDNLLNLHAEKIMKAAVEMASKVCMSRENYIVISG